MLPAEYIEYVFKRNGSLNSEDKILDEIYSFTRFIMLEHPEVMNFEGSKEFFENYSMMIKRITMNSVVWRRRFSRLLFEIQKRTEIQDDKDGDII